MSLLKHLYTFHNRGTVTSFNPDKKTKDDDGKTITLLEFHKELVRTSGKRDVFILNHKGREVFDQPVTA
jgi:hypothetical protein